jgi:hypothetical protein
LKGDKEWGTMLRKGFGKSGDNASGPNKQKVREAGWLWREIKRSRYWIVIGIIVVLLVSLIWSVINNFI